MRDPRRPSWHVLGGWIGVVIALLLVVQYLQPPRQTLAWVALFDAGHAPIFGAIALAVLRALTASPLAAKCRPRNLYVLAFGVSLLLGALSEWLQVGADRNRDFWDVAHNASGAGAFLLFAATFDVQVFARPEISSGIRARARGLAVILLLSTFVPGARVAYAYAQRSAAFPLLCDFSGTWERRFLDTNRAQLELVTVPGATSGETAAAWRIRFQPAPTAGFKLIEPYPDWTGYQQLRLVLRSEMTRPIEIVLRIHDRQHDERAADRFVRRLAIAPGTNEFSIPLNDIRSAPEGREMNMAKIARLNFYTAAAEERPVLDLLELRLQ